MFSRITRFLVFLARAPRYITSASKIFLKIEKLIWVEVLEKDKTRAVLRFRLKKILKKIAVMLCTFQRPAFAKRKIGFRLHLSCSRVRTRKLGSFRGTFLIFCFISSLRRCSPWPRAEKRLKLIRLYVFTADHVPRRYRFVHSSDFPRDSSRFLCWIRVFWVVHCQSSHDPVSSAPTTIPCLSVHRNALKSYQWLDGSVAGIRMSDRHHQPDCFRSPPRLCIRKTHIFHFNNKKAARRNFHRFIVHKLSFFHILTIK